LLIGTFVTVVDWLPSDESLCGEVSEAKEKQKFNVLSEMRTEY
jgi:hypothetical protein